MPPDPENEDPIVIDADFFQVVLEQDLANIVQKAQAGQPLTKREREMIEEERTRRSKPRAELPFTLEGEGAGKSALANLTQKDLAEHWGYSLRQVKNWIADGRKAGDPAPVAAPDQMCAWFKRIYAPRDAPEKLRLAAHRLLENQTPPPKPAEPSAPIVRIEIADEEKGLLAMLDRYRTAEVTLHNKYMAAVDAGDETRASFLLSEWSKMGEKVRSLEKTAPKALEELRIYVRRDEIQRELEPLHASILKAFRQGFRNARVRLKAADSADSWGLIVDGIVEDISTMLVESEFSEPLELQVA